MQRKPVVAIVGRPNVGKSTFVNRLVGTRKSIVDDRPGVTRDRIYFDVEWQNKHFTVIDTGGIIPGDEDEIMLNIFTQAQIACEEADKIIFVVDGKDGINPIDHDIANVLRRSKKEVFLAVNKIDSPAHSNNIADFYELAIGEPIAISALHGDGGIGDILDKLTKDFEYSEAEVDNDIIKIAIVGKPNAGKSSLLNVLAGHERAIVTDIEGTTRDILEEQIRLGDLSLNVIDTAGIRQTEDVIEKIGVDRAMEYAGKADLIIYVVDASRELDENDEKILPLIKDKNTVILLNKSDLDTVVTEEMVKKKADSISSGLPEEGVTKKEIPVISISAKEEKGIEKLEKKLKEMFLNGILSFNDQICISNVRQKNALTDAAESMKKVVESINAGMPEDFYSIDLMDAYEALGSITGESVGEDLVNEIFSKFCMGK